jgi:hypothetical protein
MGKRQELRIWSSLKHHLENTPAAKDWSEKKRDL